MTIPQRTHLPALATATAGEPETTMAHDDHAAALRRIWRRRLKELELQQAHYGVNCPPEITIEIEDLRARLAGHPEELDEDLDVTVTTPTQNGGPVSRYEFQQLTAKVDRVVLAVVLAASSLVLSSATFVIAVIALVH